MVKKEENISLPAGTKVPDHIALILDGNRRWARARGLSTLEGHNAGFEAGMKVAQAARDWGVHTFTVWGFSTENWDRSKDEINYLMSLYRKMVDEVRSKAKKEKIRFVHLGRKDRFPPELMKYIAEVEEETRHHTKHIFNAALDYGGHDEIIRAINKLKDSRFRNQDSSDITEKEFEKFLDTGDQPYPYVDLFIRTSGEQRTSGLLPWQMCYAEYFWELDHLPDMTPEKLRAAIVDYSCRRRRFGGNDKEEHLKFNPKLVARLELDWRKALALGSDRKLRDVAVAYVKEQYGLSKELAVTAGKHMASALMHNQHSEWDEAKRALKELFAVVRKNVGLAMEPELVADLQLKLWQNLASEEDLRKLYAQQYRVSDFQASKTAHLAYLANAEIEKNNFSKARGYLEKFYAALKERVA
jgi:undecaprenyl diphosphate synthase